MNINKEIDYGKHSISIDIDFDKCRVERKRPIFLFMYQNNSSAQMYDLVIRYNQFKYFAGNTIYDPNKESQ